MNEKAAQSSPILATSVRYWSSSWYKLPHVLNETFVKKPKVREKDVTTKK
tara:strand:- start:53 stop:202 length:150 start_codon:yes stop_codon:yes gene_type:complete